MCFVNECDGYAFSSARSFARGGAATLESALKYRTLLNSSGLYDQICARESLALHRVSRRNTLSCMTPGTSLNR